MIDCGNSEMRDLLPDLLNGGISSADRWRVEEHLKSCADCSAELELLTAVRALGRAVAVNSQSIVGAIAPYRRRRAFAGVPLMKIAAGIAIVAVGGASYSVASRTIWDRGLEPESTLAVAGSSASTLLDATTLGVSSELTEIDDQMFADLISRVENLSLEIKPEPKPLVKAPRDDGSLE